MLLDLHAHSHGISRCCKIEIDEVLRRAKDVGLDGIALTNHYQKNYVTDSDYAAFAKRYVEEYRRAKALGDQLGLRVLFGIEVTMEQYPKVHLVIYGVSEQLLLDHPTLFDDSQAELYRLVHAHGGILIQAHPYRFGNHLLDVSLLDGVEINCHPKYERTYQDELTKIATDGGLLLTCGADYHADTPRVRCGVYLPDTVCDTVSLTEYLTHARELRLCVTEVGAAAPNDVLFCPTIHNNLMK